MAERKVAYEEHEIYGILATIRKEGYVTGWIHNYYGTVTLSDDGRDYLQNNDWPNIGIIAPIPARRGIRKFIAVIGRSYDERENYLLPGVLSKNNEGKLHLGVYGRWYKDMMVALAEKISEAHGLEINVSLVSEFTRRPNLPRRR